MNGRNGPMSPESLGGDSPNEWSGISKYNDSPYPNPNTRGQLASPPISNSSNSTMNGGFPARGSSTNSPGNPSPPSSIARSSVGTGLYAQSESGRSKKDEQFEGTLSEHYVALKRYLASSLRDEKGNPRPNRARDKLLRLSPVQFQELSTDVFDELLRRQQTSALSRSPNAPRPGTGPPPYLLPKDTFHPKRNQARQKLSTLPPARFRDLATDVFYELERRFPRFAAGDISRMGSPASNRGPPSRNGTPVNGMNGMGPRMRRPSNASSAAFSTRSESRNGSRPPMMDPGSIPPSPGPPANDYGRPTPKTFQSNTIVPNKSTMVEDDETGGEDNDDDDGDAFGLEGAARNRPESKDALGSETDKKLIEDYQSQVAELREKLDAMEDNLKQKDDELNSVLDAERGRASAANMEKNEWSNLQRNLENKLLDAQNLNESLQSELERLRASQANSERDLRSQLEELRANGNSNGSRGGGDPELLRENQELRMELQDQQRVTEEVRIEAQEFLREMRMLSERSGSSYEREEQLSNTVNKLEKEVEDWRNRYARTKTQLRSMRASSMGLTIQQDASKYTKDSGFTQENGMVKDVHVTKFQISIDELLRTSRTDDPLRVTEFMKNVVVAVRRITQDIEEAPPASADLQQQQTKLKSRVSATANNLITASRNFASAKGLSPVSLLDAAASHLTAAVVELVRTVKIRPTPAGELDDDDDGNLEPVDTTGFFPVRDPRQNAYPSPQTYPAQQPISNAPAFQGLRNGRVSTDSSMYSPISSPRESALRPRSSGKESWNSRQGSTSRPMNGLGMMNGAFGIRPPQENDVEELKIYLEDQTALLVQNIQNLVSSIRSEASITSLSPQIIAIADVVGKVVSRTESTIQSSTNPQLRPQTEPIIGKLAAIREKLIVAREEGVDIANAGGGIGDPKWRSWNQKLPPMAFQVAKETKELVTRVDVLESEGRAGGGAEDDFS